MTIAILTACTAHNQRNKSQEAALLKQIQANDVQVIQQGARLQLIFPVDDFFRLASTDFQNRKISTIQNAALYLDLYLDRRHANTQITVSGYSDQTFSTAKRLLLSNEYADAMAAFFWNHGFTKKQLKIVGYGSLRPIANQKTAAGSAYNRRVMIQVF